MHISKENALSITCSMRVAFYDVDSYRIVWHGAYPKYLEIARCELLEKIGYTYADMEKEQFLFPIIDLHIKYIDSLVVGQYFTITATLKEWKNKLVIDYLIHDKGTGKRFTKAQTTQVAVKIPEKVTQFDAPKSLLNAVQAALN